MFLEILTAWGRGILISIACLRKEEKTGESREVCENSMMQSNTQ